MGRALKSIVLGNDSVLTAAALNNGNVNTQGFIELFFMPELSPLPDANPETALHRGILALRTERPLQEREYYYISNIGQCPRKQVAERAGLPPARPIDQRTQFKFWAGSTLHAAAQQALHAVGYLDPTKTEMRVTYESYVGRPDGVTPHFGGGAVVEIKTSDDSAITRYPDMPANYLWQGFTYCLALKLEQLVVFQIGRLQGITRHRFYHLDNEWIQAIDTHVAEMGKHWARWKLDGTLPPHVHNFPWEDRNCPYLEPKEATDGRTRIVGEKE